MQPIAELLCVLFSLWPPDKVFTNDTCLRHIGSHFQTQELKMYLQNMGCFEDAIASVVYTIIYLSLCAHFVDAT